MSFNFEPGRKGEPSIWSNLRERTSSLSVSSRSIWETRITFFDCVRIWAGLWEDFQIFNFIKAIYRCQLSRCIKLIIINLETKLVVVQDSICSLIVANFRLKGDECLRDWLRLCSGTTFRFGVVGVLCRDLKIFLAYEKLYMNNFTSKSSL